MTNISKAVASAAVRDAVKKEELRGGGHRLSWGGRGTYHRWGVEAVGGEVGAGEGTN